MVSIFIKIDSILFSHCFEWFQLPIFITGSSSCSFPPQLWQSLTPHANTNNNNNSNDHNDDDKLHIYNFNTNDNIDDRKNYITKHLNGIDNKNEGRNVIKNTENRIVDQNCKLWVEKEGYDDGRGDDFQEGTLKACQYKLTFIKKNKRNNNNIIRNNKKKKRVAKKGFDDGEKLMRESIYNKNSPKLYGKSKKKTSIGSGWIGEVFKLERKGSFGMETKNKNNKKYDNKIDNLNEVKGVNNQNNNNNNKEEITCSGELENGRLRVKITRARLVNG